jgi:UDP-N-acetylglucosamine diphosphorylase/glucosamine-1-phosphate N-acetyltransferase
MKKPLAAVILAAGKGTRMRSDLPKVFHEILGEPMLSYVIKTVQTLKPAKILVVVGHQRQLIMDYYNDWPGIEFVVQTEQLGTGHAVLQAAPALKNFDGNVLVLAGDVPLIKAETLTKLIAWHEQYGAAATDLSAELPDAGNYGRIIRGMDGSLIRIVEKKDATPEELRIKEFNTGTFCFDAQALFSALKEVKAENSQKEYYLTDTIEIIRKKKQSVRVYQVADANETLGINTKEELVAVEKILLARGQT